MVYTVGYYLALKTEGNPDICYNMSETAGCYAKKNKVPTKG